MRTGKRPPARPLFRSLEGGLAVPRKAGPDRDGLAAIGDVDGRGGASQATGSGAGPEPCREATCLHRGPRSRP